MDSNTRALDLATGFNAFGLCLYGKLPRGANCFLSPLSIATALSALLCGARGKTRREMADLLGVGYPTEALSRSIANLIISLAERRAHDYVFDCQDGGYREVEKEVFRLHLANALFVERGYPVNASYREILKADFLADVQSVDFNQPEPVAIQVNEWVVEKTKGMITDLLNPSAITAPIRLILVNAVYFLAEWLESFEESLTRPQPFYLLPGGDKESVQVAMMRNTMHLTYMEDEKLGLEALKIPYKAMSMLVLLPRPGRFQAVEEALTGDALQQILERLRPHEVSLELPKFEIESAFVLSDLLKAIGVHDAFDQTLADFSGISDDPEGLFISEVIHRARARVDEHGTEAAAATALLVVGAAADMERPKPIPFIVNRPFVFLIRDDETNAVLFLGRVINPVAKASAGSEGR